MFYVLSGSAVFHCAGEEREAGPGAGRPGRAGPCRGPARHRAARTAARPLTDPILTWETTIMILFRTTGSRRRPAGAAWPTVTVVAITLAGSAACSAEPATPTGPDQAASASAAARSDDGAEKIDGCTLLTDAEVTEIIGDNPGGVPGSAGCTWENPDTYHSVTLHIGIPGTAVDGQLPPADPILGEPEEGPDGMRFSTGEVEFAGGDRYCTLRVVTSVVDDSDRPTMIRLAGLVRDRL
nr:DUF3558 family protein [Micromonospora tarapacensis]